MVNYSLDTVDVPPNEVGLLIGVRCNANCTACWNRKIKYPYDFMALDLFKSIIAATKSGLNQVILTSFGEPLIHPDVGAMIDTICGLDENLRFDIVTNGTNADKYAAKICKMRGSLTFSIDGATKETYESIRRNLKWDDTMRIVKSCVKARTETNAMRLEQELDKWRKGGMSNIYLEEVRANLSKPCVGWKHIGINFVVTEANKHEVEKMVLLGEDLGVDYVTFIRGDLLSITDAAGLELDPNDEYVNRALDWAKKRTKIRVNDNFTPGGSCPARKDVVDKRAVPCAQPKAVPCVEPWNRIYVYPNGDVYPCCKAGPEAKLGNMAGTPLLDVWNGEVARRLRKAIREEKGKGFAKCVKCISGG